MFLTIAVVLTASCLLTEGHIDKRNSMTRVRREVSTCTDGYEDVPGSAISTMCLEDSDLYVPGSAGVDEATKATILRLHNQYREEIQDNNGSPKMLKMYWNDELARVAEKWAKQCHGGHEGKDEWRNISRYIPLFGGTSGQNKARGSGYPTFEATVTGAWYGEKQHFSYGSSTTKEIGHYTQMVNEATGLIGCGYATCTDTAQRHYVCNYMAWRYSNVKPYRQGASCSECSQHCSNGKLCDCGDKPCYHGGKMDFDTCQCQCTPFYKGDDCGQEVCPGITHCSGNHGKLDVETCECKCEYKIWTGDRCQTKTCFTPDEDACKGWKVSECSQYYNQPWECPTMCGFC